ncbi:MAG TPA: CpsD/CapB family tyrosine-protein kinase [Thermoanaerobaculia bacterium]
MTATVLAEHEVVAISDDVDPRLVSFLRPDSFEADQYRTLRYAIERAVPAEGSRVIAVTSAVPADGKTLTAVNLAGAIARGAQSRVLLIDADLRRPCVARVFGQQNVHRGWGLVDAILDRRLSLHQIVWHAGQTNLAVVTSRRPHSDTYELLASGRFAELVREAREHYDYVIIDTPPILPAPDSRLITDAVDGYVVVISADKTPRKLLEEALVLLGPTKVLGLVFNRESAKHSRYGRYYYGSPRS